MKCAVISTILTLASVSTQALEIYQACGDFQANTPTNQSLMLIGGAEANASAEVPATEWLLQQGGGGDLLVLRSGGTGSQADWLCDTFQSTQRLSSAFEASVDSRNDANNPELISLVQNAEIIFIAGGDQNEYEDFWKNTALADAINTHLLTKPIAGTSAGMAILGQDYYAPSVQGVIGSEILNDPYHANTSDIFQNDFILHPFMANTLAETHTDRRLARETRHSRVFGLLARTWADSDYAQEKYAIALDEGTFLAVDQNGLGVVFGNTAYFLKTNGVAPERIRSGSQLIWDNNGAAADVYIIEGTSNGYGEFDLLNWSGTGGGWIYWYTTGGFRKFNCQRGC